MFIQKFERLDTNFLNSIDVSIYYNRQPKQEPVADKDDGQRKLSPQLHSTDSDEKIGQTQKIAGEDFDVIDGDTNK